MKAIETIQLTKTYQNGKTALDGLDLSVECGEIFSLLGKNGVGKSTLINILTTFLKPTSGEALIMGHNVTKSPGFVRARVSCVSQAISVDDHFTIHENMLFQGRLYGLSPQQLNNREEKLLHLFQLEEYISRKAGSCSGGIKRRLDVAMSMLSGPRILFLDEPTVGMDIQSRHIMWDTLERLKKEFGTTIFLTTHYLEEADHLSDTICFIADGRRILQDSPAALRRYTPGIEEPTLEDIFIQITEKQGGISNGTV